MRALAAVSDRCLNIRHLEYTSYFYLTAHNFIAFFLHFPAYTYLQKVERYFYRQQTNCGKVMFSEPSVGTLGLYPSMHFGKCVCVCLMGSVTGCDQGVCDQGRTPPMGGMNTTGMHSCLLINVYVIDEIVDIVWKINHTEYVEGEIMAVRPPAWRFVSFFFMWKTNWVPCFSFVSFGIYPQSTSDSREQLSSPIILKHLYLLKVNHGMWLLFLYFTLALMLRNISTHNGITKRFLCNSVQISGMCMCCVS